MSIRPNTVFGDVAKAPPKMAWHQRSPLGDKIGPGNRDYENMSRLDAFLLMFPPAQLEHCRKLTETKLKGTSISVTLSKRDALAASATMSRQCIHKTARASMMNKEYNTNT